ncbi:OmpP1/FadL family transporter [Aliiroseovarius sp.]|uniref:OmpP1/FadL family transporter n=1 Tax=Aliiroseovarius sp. TaxID=1872442 RepID=UPI003BAD9363
MSKMKTGALAALMMGSTALTASAAGLDRSGQDVTLLFEEGNVAEVSLGYVDPHLTAAVAGISDAGKAYAPLSFGYKHQFTENISVAILYDQPYGADIEYTDGPFSALGPLPLNGQAEVNTDSFTILGRYEFGNGFSVHGGARLERIEGYVVSSPGILDVESDWDVGGVIGVAYEVPEIALRVALTYSTAIDHGVTGTEDVGFANLGSGGIAPLADATFTITAPESVNLDFQTGIAENTLLFGSIRWVHWDGFNVTSPNSAPEYVGYTNDDYTVNVGVGRRINDELSLAASVGYERRKYQTVSTLGPTDGYWSLGLGGSYTMGDTKFSAGVRYVLVGDAITTTGGVPFRGNHATAVGFSVQQTF